MFVQIFADHEGLHKLAVMMNDGCPRPLSSTRNPTCPTDLVKLGSKRTCQECWERYLTKYCTIVSPNAIKCAELFEEAKKNNGTANG